MSGSQQMNYPQSTLPSCLRIGFAPASTSMPTMDDTPRLRSTQGLPQIPKMAPLEASFDDQPSQAESPLQAETADLVESPVCVQDLSNFDGHVHDERLSSEDLTKSDGHMHLRSMLPREMEQSVSSASQDDDTDRTWRSVHSEVGPSGLAPPPESQVMKYSRKALPSPPSPSAKNRGEAVERISKSVRFTQPTIYLQPRAARSYAASIHGTVEGDGVEELPCATNQTAPVPPTWLSRVNRRDTFDQKCFEDRISADHKR